MKHMKKPLSDSSVEKMYVEAGATFGDVVSYLYMGECAGFSGLLDEWAKWEKEYAHRGFRTVSLDRFVDLGGYGKLIDDVIGQKREEGEEPIFYAQIYRNEFLGKIAPTCNLEKMIIKGECQVGVHIIPSIKQSE